jgi:aldehyde:ferredoxin oxidoreductase
MSRILRIDLGTRTASEDAVPERWRGLGGRGLTSAIVAEGVPPGADPLGAESLLVLAPGILAGTSVPNSGRLSVGGVSPLTGTIKEANAGGSTAQKLARLGFAAVVVRGSSPEPTVVRISAAGVAFEPAGDLWGRGNYAVVEKLREAYPGSGLVTVGPAGEGKLKAAAVCVTTPDYLLRTAARGGLGAVMGSKGLKAVIVDDSGAGPVATADPERFKAAAGALVQGITSHPLTGGFQALGTAMLVPLINELGALPTRNYSAGRFAGADAIGGEALAKNMGTRPGAASKHRCMNGCVIHCSQVYTDAKGALLTSGFEYETLGMVGSNCAIDDPDAIARIDRACDDLGLDTMEVGAALAVAMEGGRVAWGDGARALQVVLSSAMGDPLGILIGSGCEAVGKALGVRRVPAVKGQSLAAYDPRVLKGTGVTYATCPMGADHTAGNALPSPSNPSYDPSSPQGQGQMSAFLQTYFAAIDTLGVCLFASLPILESPELQGHLVDAVSAKLGAELPAGYLPRLGEQVCRGERDYNERRGFGPAHDRLPPFFASEALPPHGGVWDVSDADLDAVWG